MSEMILETPEAGSDPALSEDPVAQAYALLKERFPEEVQDDSRDGYTGLMVSAEKLPEIATALRDAGYAADTKRRPARPGPESSADGSCE